MDWCCMYNRSDETVDHLLFPMCCDLLSSQCSEFIGYIPRVWQSITWMKKLVWEILILCLKSSPFYVYYGVRTLWSEESSYI